MNIQKNEPHGIGIHDKTTLYHFLLVFLLPTQVFIFWDNI
jgi:hypothetical protein